MGARTHRLHYGQLSFFFRASTTTNGCPSVSHHSISHSSSFEAMYRYKCSSVTLASWSRSAFLEDTLCLLSPVVHSPTTASSFAVDFSYATAGCSSGGKSESGRNLARRQKRSRNARTLDRCVDVTTHDRSPQSVDWLVKLWVAARKYFWPFLDYPCRHGLEVENRRFFVPSWFL